MPPAGSNSLIFVAARHKEKSKEKQVTGNFLTLPDLCGGETLEEKQGKTSHWQLSNMPPAGFSARFLGQ